MGQGDDGPNAGQRQKYAEIQAEMEADMQYFDDPAVVHDMECVWYLHACMSARACERASDTHTHTHTHTHTGAWCDFRDTVAAAQAWSPATLPAM